tara:strand:+ start:219 stop:383 length:165 start_codon:yes stop_codon:yes gene_type:complete
MLNVQHHRQVVILTLLAIQLNVEAAKSPSKINVLTFDLASILPKMITDLLRTGD